MKDLLTALCALAFIGMSPLGFADTKQPVKKAEPLMR